MLIALRKLVMIPITLLLLSTVSCLRSITKYSMATLLPTECASYTPSFTFFYQGNYFQSSQNLELYTQSYAQDFYLVVAQNLQVPVDLEINNLQTKKDSLYRWWHITCNESGDTPINTPKNCVWQAQELDNKQAIVELPSRSIILFWNNPDDIVTLKPSVSPSNDLYCILPCLVLEPTLSLESFKEKLFYMHDISMNFKFCHTAAKNITLLNKNNTSQVITMQVSSNKYIAV